MTKDVIELAREAGFPFNKYGLLQGDCDGEIEADAMFASFAALVAARERERCAQLVASQALRNGYPPLVAAAQDFAKQCAAAIRALNTEGEVLDATTAQKGESK